MAGWRNLADALVSETSCSGFESRAGHQVFQASGGKADAPRSKRGVLGHCGFDSHLAYQVAPRLPMVRRTVSKAVARG